MWNTRAWLLAYSAFASRASRQMDSETVDDDNRRISMQRRGSVRPPRWRGESADATTQCSSRARQHTQTGALWTQLFEREDLRDARRALGCQLGEQRQTGAVSR